MAGNEEANRRLQERLSRPSESWEDFVIAALVGDPVFYGVVGSITVVVLAFVGLMAAKVLIDQIEEEEQREKRREQKALRAQNGEEDEDEDEPEDKKEQ
ncbi:hypothetical protein Gpo141_00006354 [Globisporangium polare]